MKASMKNGPFVMGWSNNPKVKEFLKKTLTDLIDEAFESGEVDSLNIHLFKMGQ